MTSTLKRSSLTTGKKAGILWPVSHTANNIRSKLHGRESVSRFSVKASVFIAAVAQEFAVEIFTLAATPTDTKAGHSRVTTSRLLKGIRTDKDLQKATRGFTVCVDPRPKGNSVKKS